MSAVTLHFAGQFVCRLAMNPDPYDHPRGRSGISRAYPGEPDFDRRVDFGGRAAYLRTHTRCIPVEIFGTSPSTFAPLFVGSKVELVANGAGHFPKFEGRDGLVAPPGQEPIVPLWVRAIHRDGRGIVECRYVNTLNDISSVGYNVTYGANIDSIVDETLRSRIDVLHDSTQRAIDERILNLNAESAQGPENLLRLRICRMQANKNLDKRFQCVRATAAVSSGLVGDWPLAERPKAADDWPFTAYFFGFDFDALVGCVVGNLTIPIRV